MRRIWVSFSLFAGLLGACGPSQSAKSPAMSFTTTATLVGPLCSESGCKCADRPKDAGMAPAGKKRFEIILGPSTIPSVASIGDGQVHKMDMPLRKCFYVDLAPGKHPVTLKTQAPEGISAGIQVRELGIEGAYETFRFQCGAPGYCETRAIERFSSRVDGYHDSLHDRCGSTKIRGLKWEQRRMPRSRILTELTLQFTLHVYEFIPEKAPCGGNVE